MLKSSTDFSPSTRWIWADHAVDGWWMFRKSFALPAEVQAAHLRISAAFYYVLYVNGTLVTRGPGTSYDFNKSYDVVDVLPFLHPGADNVVAILAPSVYYFDPHVTNKQYGLLAELSWQTAAGDTGIISTDGSWKTRQHAAFPDEMPGYAMTQMLGFEEQFDARRESVGWQTPGYDDSRWETAHELGPVSMAPWTSMQPCEVGLLSEAPIFPKVFTAIELAQLCPGYRVRLSSPGDCIKVFATEVTCAGPTPMRLRFKSWPPTVYVNGKQVDVEAEILLRQGANLLCCCQLGYWFPTELEMVVECAEALSFSAGAITGVDADWAECTFPAQVRKYPWHETNEDVLESTPNLSRLLATSSAAVLPADLQSGFVAAQHKAPSAYLDVITQRFYTVPGGHTDPAIQKGQPRLRPDGLLHSPLQQAGNVLYAHPDATVLLPTEGFDAHFIVDFERERLGYVQFQVDAPAGTVIDIQCFELIDGRGIAWMEYLNGFRYICREGVQTFTSHIRRGFRYVSVTLRGFSRPVKFYSLNCQHTAYPSQQIGSFECSDWQLNHIFHMSADTAALCMLDTYVDCPGHEQAFWSGDAHITALINMLLYGAYDLDQRSIRLVGQSLSPDWIKAYHPDDESYLNGRFLTFAAFPQYPDGDLPMWTFLWAMQCWHHYLYGANLDDLRENYAYVAEMLRHCRVMTNARGLFDKPGARNLIEWGANDLSPYGEVTANNVLLVLCLRQAAAMAEVLGSPAQAASHRAEADERMAAINHLCWDEQRQAYVDTIRDEWAYQRYLEFARSEGWAVMPWEEYLSCSRVSEQTNTLALLCDCVPLERQEAISAIVRRVEAGYYRFNMPAHRTHGVPSEEEAPDGIVPIGSPFFLFFSLAALYKINEPRIALEVIRRDWGKMAATGVRTCWETFAYNEVHWTRSVAHAWSAAPAVYLPMQVLGVRPLEPGYRKFVVDPCVDDLHWARGSVATPYGPIYVHWQRNDQGGAEITCTAPDECEWIENTALLIVNKGELA